MKYTPEISEIGTGSNKSGYSKVITGHTVSLIINQAVCQFGDITQFDRLKRQFTPTD